MPDKAECICVIEYRFISAVERAPKKEPKEREKRERMRERESVKKSFSVE